MKLKKFEQFIKESHSKSIHLSEDEMILNLNHHLGFTDMQDHHGLFSILHRI